MLPPWKYVLMQLRHNKNAVKHNVKIDIICEDLFTFHSKTTLDLIVSNPPYITYSQKAVQKCHRL